MKQFTDKVDQLLPSIYVVLSLLLAVVSVWKLPPFMAPDELNHLKRANLLVHGSLFGDKVILRGHVLGGGLCEVTVNQVEAAFHPIAFHPDKKVDPVAVGKVAPIRWGEKSEWQSFENTAPYPPFFYLPAAFALALAKALNLTILQSLTLCRLSNALICLAIGFGALRIASSSRLLLFTTLLLPMTGMLDSTVTQDGLLIATASLAAAIICRATEQGRPLRARESLLAAICLALDGIAKPPLLLMGFLLLLVPTDKPRTRSLSAAVVIAFCVIWNVLVALFVQAPIQRPDAVTNPGGQIHYLLSHPISLLAVPFETLRHSILTLGIQFVGVLGWLDTPLPKAYYAAGAAILIMSVALTWSIKTRPEWKALAWGVAILVATKFAIVLALYVSYTPVGASQADGVQGRYFLPLMAILPVLLVGHGALQTQTKWRAALQVLLISFPLGGILVVERTLSLRFY